ncbi:RNA polymerase I transcription termination factor Reb1 [Schizosaccharomyces japonicus yFS275]|uniref:RNA polymerase I transcription termination factor Reb1 n=1 Tax=Schizosaccharomyces japonicus (strain yFS275 / FY16936) TaxID=402676 RepID=B6K7Y2_SCHJY|nr:RNA polymerase I transcription termination factor Reb1 [Schizosaccharomyces japonicus yFS275]EEB09636.1 RNA polymerase I transcription termination factor Reb1 [Schizosaccharomyces japonicus yFS275]
MNDHMVNNTNSLIDYVDSNALDMSNKRRNDFDDTFIFQKTAKLRKGNRRATSDGLVPLSMKEEQKDARDFEALISLQSNESPIVPHLSPIQLSSIAPTTLSLRTAPEPNAFADSARTVTKENTATTNTILLSTETLSPTPVRSTIAVSEPPSGKSTVRWTAEHWEYLESRMQSFCQSYQLTHAQVAETLRDKRLHGPLSALVKLLVEEMPSFTRRTILRHLRALYNIPGYEKYSRKDTSGKGDFGIQETAIISQEVSNFIASQGWSKYQFCNQIWAGKCPKVIRMFYSNLYKKLSHRDAKSIYHHVRRAYNPFEERCIWSKEDDEELKRNVMEHGKSWAKIGRKMARMPNDCRDRWRDVVRFGDRLKRNAWSSDEEQQLLRIVHDIQTGDETNNEINWTLVAQMLGTRTRLQCRYKYQQLTKPSKKFEVSDSVWLLESLLDNLAKHAGEIHWEEIVSASRGRWTTDQLQTQLEVLKRSVVDYTKRDLADVIQTSLRNLKSLLSGY